MNVTLRARDSVCVCVCVCVTQVKGLQAEYERVTKAGDGKGSSQDSGVSGSGETGVLKQKVDKLIQEKMDLQVQRTRTHTHTHTHTRARARTSQR